MDTPDYPAEDPLAQAMARMQAFVDESVSGTVWSMAHPDAVERNTRLHEEAQLCITRADLRLILAAARAAREDADDRRWEEVIAKADPVKLQTMIDRARQYAARAANQEGT